MGAVSLAGAILRMASRPSVQALAFLQERPHLTDIAGPAPFLLADLEERFATVRRREKPALGVAVAGLLFAIPFVLAAAVPALDSLVAVCLPLPIWLVALRIAERRHDGLRKGIGLVCPSCRVVLEDVVLYLGRCTSCGLQLLAPSDRRPMTTSPITTGSPLRNAVGTVVLIALVAWSLDHISDVMPSHRDRGDKPSFVASYWWVMLLAALLTAWLWRAWRRASRASARSTDADEHQGPAA